MHSGLVYSVSSEFNVKRTRGLYAVEYACDPANVAKARAIIVQNLKRMQTEPVDDRDLQRARALALREIPLSESSIDGIAQGFLRRVELDLPLDEPTRAARRYVKLTAADVQAAYKKYLRPADFVPSRSNQKVGRIGSTVCSRHQASGIMSLLPGAGTTMAIYLELTRP
jgi:zinc protease